MTRIRIQAAGHSFIAETHPDAPKTGGLIQGAAKIYEVPYIDTVIAEHPYMIARWVGGTMVFTGNLVWLYNMWMTAREGTLIPAGRLPHELAYER